MFDTDDFLIRNRDYRSDYFDRILRSYKELVKRFLLGKRTVEGKLVLLGELANGFDSPYMRQMKISLAKIDKPLLEQFERGYWEILESF